MESPSHGENSRTGMNLGTGYVLMCRVGGRACQAQEWGSKLPQSPVLEDTEVIVGDKARGVDWAKLQKPKRSG